MSEYLKIVFQNLEPVRISDDSASQSGQTITLRYIPGTALRGVVINALAQEEDFKSVKKNLFSSKIRYLNAYLTDGEEELIPSPKGFYEDKTEQHGKKKVDNVVIKGEFEEGNKRASLGRFCRMDGDCVYCYNVNTGSDMKIKMNLQEDEKQNVFRNEYICAGYVFTGYIAVDDSALRDRIKKVFSQDFAIGNARSQGLGKCKIISCGYTDRLPYQDYLPTENQEKECYMLLLSNMAMRGENGELCGLDCGKLEEKMGVETLRVEYCATSTVNVKGYNRVWKAKLPSAVMYEQGSVFHLRYQGTFSKEKMLGLCDQGIGIRLNEGFGRVIFLNGYENIKYKETRQFKKETVSVIKEQHAEDRETLKAAAKCYYRSLLEKKMTAYVVNNPLPKGKIANSQLGILASFTTAYKYNPQEAKRTIGEYLEHAFDKEENVNVQKERNSIRVLKQYVQTVFDTDIETLLCVSTKQKESIMGIPKSSLIDEDGKLKIKLELITRLIRYDNKKEEA